MAVGGWRLAVEGWGLAEKESPRKGAKARRSAGTAAAARALLQTHEKLVRRGWSRPRARDYYDLWRIPTAYSGRLHGERIRPLLEAKCAHRGIVFHGPEAIFSEELVSEASRHWESTLAPFVSELPEWRQVLEQLQELVSDISDGLSVPFAASGRRAAQSPWS